MNPDLAAACEAAILGYFLVVGFLVCLAIL